jgi:hypothetical protein
MPQSPLSNSTPGVLPGEGEGRLINVIAINGGERDIIRRVPGSTAFANAGFNGCYGLIEIDGVDVPSI